MKASRLGFLSVALVFGLSACEMVGTPGPGPDPIPDDGSGGTGSGGVPTPDPDPIPDPGGDPNSLPTGDFGVSTSASGPFTNDSEESGGNIVSDSDERIVSVSDGSTFYAQVQYSDPDGISGIVINLVNSMPEGFRGPLSTTEEHQGFILAGEPTGDCDLSGSATEVTCVYAVNVAAGTQDIEELPGAGDEFAYVFRTQVTDTAGNTSDEAIRGYVNIE